MFLECRTIKITVPKSNEVSFVFPFSQCFCKFNRKGYDPSYVDPNKYTKEEIDEVLDKIEKTCGHFKKMQRCTVTTIISLVAFITMIIVGNVLLNIGLSKNSDTGEVEFAKFKTNGLVISGAATLFVGIVQLILVIILVAYKTRKLRVYYENITAEIISNKNQELKGSGLRWKVGRCFNWIELSLDYKMSNLIVKQPAFAPKFLRKGGSLDNESIPLAII